MSDRSAGYRERETDAFGFAGPKWDFAESGNSGTHSPEEVVGDIGVVLVVIFGIIIAINMILGALHVA